MFYCGKYIYKAVLFNQQMLSQVEKYIYEALSINDNVVRPKAEANLFKLAKQQCTEFFTTLAHIIADINKKREMRQLTCTVFSRLVSFKINENTVYWDNVQPNMKPEIKDMLLSTLISDEAVIVKGGANTIANIASIEIPRGEWLDIIITLAQNTQHEEYNIRKASVLTLGYICQQLRNMKQTISNRSSCQQILGGLLMSLEKEGEIVEMALQAMRDSIPFLKNIFMEQIEFSNKMFQYIIPILDHENYRQKVYEILFEFSKQCYNLLENYIDVIVEFTIKHIQSRDEDTILALTLWQTIGTEYLERKEEKEARLNENAFVISNYILRTHKRMLPEVMGCNIILNERDLEFKQLRQAASSTLSIMIECGNRQMVDLVTDGVAKVLVSPNAGERQATVLLFSCLSNYEDKYDIQNRFKLGFNHLYSLLHDPQTIVIKNTLSGFASLSQVFPQVFLMNTQIKEIVFHLLGMAKSNDQLITLLTLTILNNITEVLKDYPDPIAKDPQNIITEVVKMFDAGLQDNSSNKQASQKLIILLMNIIMYTDQLKIVNQLIEHLIHQYKHYASINIRDKAIILEHIVTVIHTCLLAFTKTVIPNTEHKDEIFRLIDDHINFFGVQAEGINLISAAANCYKRDFKYKIDRYWDKIMHGLSLTDQKPIFKAALTCISDISRSHQSEFIQKLNLVFEKLVQYMHQNIDRELKTQILKCFGDLALGMKKYCHNYIPQILQIVQNCMSAVYLFEQNQAEKAYAEELKQSLIEMYHCVVFAINSQQRVNNTMANHYQSIAQFIVRTCDVKYRPTVDYLRNCLYLVFDSALFYLKNENYRRQIEQVIDSSQIRNLVEIIKRYRDRPDVQDLLTFIETKVRIGRR